MTDTPERPSEDGVPPIPTPPAAEQPPADEQHPAPEQEPAAEQHPAPDAATPEGASPETPAPATVHESSDPLAEADVATASVPVVGAPAAFEQQPTGVQPTAAYPTEQFAPTQTMTAPPAQYPAPGQYPPPAGQLPPGAPPPRRSNKGVWIALAVVGGVIVLGILILVILVVVAFATARHWTKVDEPAQPATYHSEEYQTGNYDVTDDHVNPCSVGQDWTDCINLMVDQYNGACAGTPLTGDGQTLCDDYLNEINTMKGQDGSGVYVSSLGGYGHLTKTPETATRQVSNHDAKPAKTHTATCYLGFIGECRGMPKEGGSGPAVSPSPASGSGA